MVNVGTTLDDLGEYLAEAPSIGAWARGAKVAPRAGVHATHWDAEGIREALLQSGKLVLTSAPGATATALGCRRRGAALPRLIGARGRLMPGERTEAHRNSERDPLVVRRLRRTLFSFVGGGSTADGAPATS